MLFSIIWVFFKPIKSINSYRVNSYIFNWKLALGKKSVQGISRFTCFPNLIAFPKNPHTLSVQRLKKLIYPRQNVNQWNSKFDNIFHWYPYTFVFLGYKSTSSLSSVDPWYLHILDLYRYVLVLLYAYY